VRKSSSTSTDVHTYEERSGATERASTRVVLRRTPADPRLHAAAAAAGALAWAAASSQD